MHFLFKHYRLAFTRFIISLAIPIVLIGRTYLKPRIPLPQINHLNSLKNHDRSYG